MPACDSNRWRLAGALLISLVILIQPSTAIARSNQITIACAADLHKAFDELIPRFEKRAGIKVEPVYGSSGLLAKQIEQGAPFDALFAANRSYVEDLEKKGKVVRGSIALYARGRLALVARRGVPGPNSLNDLTRPEYFKIAIANPDHAPYGLAAREALQKLKLWDRVQPKIVFGENIQATLQYIDTGNADAAIVALSLVQGRGKAIDERLHSPLDQAAGVVSASRNQAAARQFVAFVCGPEGQRILKKFGLARPDARKRR